MLNYNDSELHDQREKRKYPIFWKTANINTREYNILQTRSAEVPLQRRIPIFNTDDVSTILFCVQRMYSFL